MNKKVLISAILTAAPTAQLSATEIVSIRTEALAPLTAKQSSVFKLPAKVLGEDDTYEMTVSLISANVSEFHFWDVSAQDDAKAPELDYELLVEFKSVKTGKVVQENLNYLLKAVGEGKFALHQTNTTTVAKEITERDTAYEVITCNTTANCDLNSRDKGLVLIKGDELTIVNPSAVFAGSFSWEDLEGRIEKTLVLKKTAE